ncbi:hypothetical protein N7509_006131 [Penicillium cosmopolitanum]|uniref:Urease accessory protein UreD n=1 Tax=Penicillium cosmopolitanum TaxID=1131564 RepID=A0A9W9W3J6_9EURO|nr:uncharacterized protein N7509_006131 [Penicillium cosmopolitanum]KAJ5398018.1 hypothetical protein N7509_006131 [Penicillium cosmopolitanum]
MPHKHKRREQDASQFDLPPSVIAKALPVRNPESKAQNNQKPGQKGQKQQQGGSKKDAVSLEHTRSKRAKEDDTPRAFRHSRPQADVHPRDSSREKKKTKADNKKRKREDADNKGSSSKKPAKTLSEQKEAAGKDANLAIPKILPGEKLSDFSARVDRALPLAAITKTQAGQRKDRDHKMTKHEKHLRKLQAGWREDEAKIREKEQEEKEEREEEMEEQIELMKKWDLERRGGKARKKGTVPKKKNGDVGDDDPDPWAKLKKRDKERKANPFEVAQAPPELKAPREIFKVRGGAKVDVANVPNAVGSLRRREELASERRNIVEEYRRMVAERRQ